MLLSRIIVINLNYRWILRVPRLPDNKTFLTSEELKNENSKNITLYKTYVYIDVFVLLSWTHSFKDDKHFIRKSRQDINYLWKPLIWRLLYWKRLLSSCYTIWQFNLISIVMFFAKSDFKRQYIPQNIQIKPV